MSPDSPWLKGCTPTYTWELAATGKPPALGCLGPERARQRRPAQSEALTRDTVYDPIIILQGRENHARSPAGCSDAS